MSSSAAISVAGRKLVLAPVDREPPVGEIEPRFDDARKPLQAAFDLADAAGAADALDRKIDMRSAVAMLHERRKIERLRHGTAPNSERRDCATETAARRRATDRSVDPIDRSLRDRCRETGPRSPRSAQRRVGAPVGRPMQRRDAPARPASGWPVGVARVDLAPRSRRRPGCTFAFTCQCGDVLRARGFDVALERQPGLNALPVSTPPKVEIAARIMIPFTIEMTAKNAIRQIRTVRPVSGRWHTLSFATISSSCGRAEVVAGGCPLAGLDVVKMEVDRRGGRRQCRRSR